MTFPASLTLVTVHGRVDLPPSGGAAGTAVFSSHQPLVGSVDHSVVPPFETTAVLAADGTFTASLPATNDPQWTPTGWAYTVVIRPGGGGAIRGTLQLDYQTADVQLADLLQVDGTTVPGQSYIMLSARGVAGGVAALDVDGDVTDATGAKITGGGGGGGASPASTVSDGTAFGVAKTAGVATSYSRGDHAHGTPAAPTPASIGAAPTSHTHTASQISDSTATGRSVLTAADATAARTAIGAGTSSLALGTTSTTAAAGDAPAAAIAAHVAASDPHTQYALETNLGGAALLNVGTSAGTVAAGNDSRITGAAQKASNLSDLASAATARTNLTVLASILLGPSDPIPGGTPTNTLVIRTT